MEVYFTKAKSMEGYMMISIWIYAALVTERQIPKRMRSHDAQVSFCLQIQQWK